MSDGHPSIVLLPNTKYRSARNALISERAKRNENTLHSHLVSRDFDWGGEKRRPVFGEGLVVVVNLEALGTNSGNVLKIISRPEN